MRSDDLIDREQLFAALKSCRHDIAISMSRMQINGPLYVAASELLCSIDAVAFILTNRPDVLHMKPHGTRPTSP